MEPPALTPWLTFTDTTRERRYRQEQRRRVRPHLLTTLVVGTAVFILFGTVDLLLAREHIHLIFWMRYGLILPYGLVLLWTSRHWKDTRWVIRHYQIYITLAGLMLLAVMMVLGPTGQLYYPGLLLLLVFTFTVSGLDLRDALPPALALLFTSLLFLWQTPTLDPLTRGNDALGMVLTLLLAMSGGYMLERLRRLTFLQMEWLQQERDRLARLSRTDPLTGLANRRVLKTHLGQELRKAERYGIPVSFWMVDMDHFKPFNDTHGHPTGDQALRVLAGSLQHTARRAGDLVARYGGDEFAVFLFGFDPGEACRLAHRFLERLHRDSAQELPQPLSASVGVAGGIPHRGLTADHLIRLADAALYRAKEKGASVVCEPLPVDPRGRPPGEGSGTP